MDSTRITGPVARHPDLEPSWLTVLGDAFGQPYMRDLRLFLQSEKRTHTVYPPGRDIFNAFWFAPFDRVKVVILGQDPYHGPDQAHGLSFSVRPGVAIPPSLRNIFTELNRDLGVSLPTHGCLQHWAEQGVLMLNSVLTVRANSPQSHANQGWEQFTDRVITELNRRRDGLIFALWGAPAQRKASYVERGRHTVLVAPHPSPLSAYRGFIGCGHFSQINQQLSAQGLTPIDWSLPPRTPGEHLRGQL